MQIAKDNLGITISFKIPAALNQKVNEHVIAQGNGMKGKGKWLREAIELFLNFSDFPELVAISDGFESSKDSDSFLSTRITLGLDLKIEQAVLLIRKQYPELEGIKSKIFRSAIIQRLLNRRELF